MAVLKEVTTATRASTITTQNFAKVQQEIIDDVKNGIKDPPRQPEPPFTYPLRLTAKTSLKPEDWSTATPKKLIIIGETRWNAKYYAIVRAYRLRPAIQKYLSDKNPALLAPFISAMGTEILFLCSLSVN